MNTIRSVITGVSVVAAATGSAAVLASSGTASAGTSSAGTSYSARAFTLRAHGGSDANIDLGASGFSAGDEDLFSAPMTRAGKAAGRLVGNCTTARVTKTADQLCEFVLRLHGGQLTASGTVRSGQSGPGTFTLPILGGTGRYQGAGGQIAVTATSGKSFPIKVSVR
jgi:hypothetical protein